MKKVFFLLLIASLATQGFAQTADSTMISRIFTQELTKGECYENLRQLCKGVGARLSGSPQAAKAVKWGWKTLEKYEFDRVVLQKLNVPHWVRGEKELARIYAANSDTGFKAIPITALGGSIATPEEGLRANMVEVKTFEELRALGKEKVNGKIVFFNRPMDPSKVFVFQAYGGAVNQRGQGAVEAAKMGAVGAIVRSMTVSIDNQLHTGAMHYNDSVPQIPAAAITTADAEKLSKMLKKDAGLTFYFKQNCKTLPDTVSHNIIAELKGSESTDIIAVGGHLDSWDLGEGAHDDGAGIVQSMEALRILKAIGYKPRHTLRCVFFMNEENGLRGGKKYAELAEENNEKHIAAIETDAGGFSPRGFSMSGTKQQLEKIRSWKPLLEPYGLHQFTDGGGGADISLLEAKGVPCFELRPDSQRYFDFHHTPADKFEAVNRRELEMGAASLAAFIYLIDQYGL